MPNPDHEKFNVVDTIRQSAPVDTTLPYDITSLAGKVILITGGASGFGASFARHWASHGAHIIIGDINDAAGEELAAELRTLPGSSGHHHFQHCDVTKWEDQLALFQAAVRSSPTGGIDAVVANAGVIEKETAASGGGFENPSGLDMDENPRPAPPPLQCVAVNLTGVMYTAHLALYWLPKNQEPKQTASSQDSPSTQPPQPRDRHLLLIGSVAGLMPITGQPEYTVSKHGVTGLFRSLRGTVFQHGIRVNMICPYFVETPLIPTPGMLMLAGAALGSVGDVVDAATRLVADEAIRGRALVVGPKMRVVDEEDGGWKVVEREGGARTQPVWECYAHDYEQVEEFVLRYIRLLNAVSAIRGWVGTLKDVVNALFFRRKARV